MIITKIDPRIARAARANPIVRGHLQRFLDFESSWEEATYGMISDLVAENKKLARQLKPRRPRVPR